VNDGFIRALVGITAATAAVLAVALLTVKLVHWRLQRSAAVRRAHYVGAVGEILARGLRPAGASAWAEDPIFQEVLLEYVDLVAGAERARLEDLVEELDLRTVLVRRLRRSRLLGKRLDAASRLAVLATPGLEPILLETLADRSPDVRGEAARGLARLRSERALPVLIDLLTGERPWDAARIADRLVEYGPVAVPALSARLRSQLEEASPPVEAARLVVRVLGLIGDLSACPALLPLLHHPHPELRIAAASALGRAGTLDAVDPLLAALGDPDWRVRARAAASLATFSDPRSVEPLGRALSDPGWWVRQNAAESLTELPGGLERLVAAVEGPDRFAADAALLQLGLKGAVRAARTRAEQGHPTELDVRLLGALDRPLPAAVDAPAGPARTGRGRHRSRRRASTPVGA
jgi:HEAT repeat protein